ncbi:hypothetical protein [Xylanibacter muris]|uniref:Lipoprotein n=1 Tax=Xylanibacter muris TaxID=2736290 RepID=A0ABX2AMV1_9BACT|nr:hypothetical protein [Xylanibacter muris]NPD92233.1 hypothetical protein [Xylanibacter muris]
MKRSIFKKQAGALWLMAAMAVGCGEAPPPVHEVEFDCKVLDFFDVSMRLQWDSIPGSVRAEYCSMMVSMLSSPDDRLLLKGNIEADSTMVLTGEHSRNFILPNGSNKHIEQKDEWKLRLCRTDGDSLVLTGEVSSDGQLNGSVRMMGKENSQTDKQ